MTPALPIDCRMTSSHGSIHQMGRSVIPSLYEFREPCIVRQPGTHQPTDWRLIEAADSESISRSQCTSIDMASRFNFVAI